MHFPQIHGALSGKGSPSGRAGERSETGRARPLTTNPRHCDSIALTKSLPITAQRLFPAGLALSVTFGDTSPKGRGFGRPQGAKNPPWRSQLLGGFLIAGDESAGFSHFCLYCMPFSPKVKHCTESLQSLFSWHLLYLFVKVYDIMSLRLVPPNLPRMGEGGCRLMAYIFTFVLSVAANVASYYICKWLDGWLKGRKH